ncbi:ABC transporter permease [Ornithinimicrobium pratense]|nr:ABC transporter permease [Ornithinimicrobium pratense]
MSELVARRASVSQIGALGRFFGAGGLGGPIIMLVVLVGLLWFLSDGVFLSQNNLVNILRQFSVPLILAMGQTLVIITAGIDLSVASTAALSACVMGIMYTQIGLGGWLAVLLGVLTGLLVGLINGFVITKWRVPDFVATLGAYTAVRGVALLITDGYPIPNHGVAIPGRTMPEVVQTLGSQSLGPIPIIAIVAVVLVLATWVVLNRTTLGRRLIAAGGNAEAARVAGINVQATKIYAYLIAGGFAAIGGILMAGRLDSANGLMAPAMELTTIAAVVLGGTALAGGEGRVGGTVIGVAILASLANGLNILGVSSFWQDVATGVVLVLVVALDQFRRRLSGKRNRAGAAPPADTQMGTTAGGGAADQPVDNGAR